MTRPSWDSIWMAMAELVAARSIDPRRKVGCVIVSSDNTRVEAIGYNGSWRGGPNEVESTEPGCSGTIHAEANALIKFRFAPHKRHTMYVTTSPCLDCAKLIINAQIDEVVYLEPYRDSGGVDLLRKAGVTIRWAESNPKAT